MDKSTFDYASTVEWLLSSDNPGVRYLALRDHLAFPVSSSEFIAARKEAYQNGPIALVLSKMDPEGFWEKPGPGYGPKYKSTVWAIILLAQLGASVDEDPRVRTACEYLLKHALSPGGHFSHNGAPGGTFDCLQGNLCWALTQLGVDEPELDEAYEWMARSQIGTGIAPKEAKSAEPRYYAYKCGPGFQCGANNNLPCAWGAVKVGLALGVYPTDKHTPFIRQAIQRFADFIFSVDPTIGDWPFHEKISQNWWKFGFPVFYSTDLLQVAEAMVSLGFGEDPRMAKLISLITEKQDGRGMWPLEYSYAQKTWGNYGPIGQPNKWVTLRALRVLRLTGRLIQ